MNIRQISLAIFYIFTLSLTAQSTFSLSKDSSVFSTVVNHQRIIIESYGSKSFRVLKYPDNNSIDKTSISVVRKQGEMAINVLDTDEAYILNTLNTTIVLSKAKATVSFYDANRNLLLTENNTEPPFIATTDVNGNGYIVKQRFKLASDEAIYGLGQDQRGIMNYRGQSVWLKQRNMFVAVPFLISSKAYGILWDNTSITNFRDNADGASFESEIGDCIDYYFISGESMDATISAYRELTGKAPMFPKWAFGFMQSRERYTNEKELTDVVKKYRELKLPIDCIIQDWRYWGDKQGQWNSTEFDPAIFPDPKRMIDEIHSMNAHAMISVWPSFGNTSQIYNDLNAKNLLLNFKTFPNTGNEKVYDAFDSRGREILWKHLNKNIFSAGMDAWWLDATEPEQSDPQSHIDSIQTALGAYKRVANAYPIFTNKGVYEHQRMTSSEKRVFILTRSAFAGQQRFATSVWSGDIVADWDVFRNQISAGVNFSMSGIPYWTTDIGAFTVDQNKFPGGNKNPLYQELYARWFQFGAFCPLFRSHGSSTPREVYNFGQEGDWAFDVQKKYLHLRYRLLPYIYSLAWQVTSEDASLIRAAVMDFPSDTIARNINNQYLFGPSLLVAPVTEAQYVFTRNNRSETSFEETKQREIYLPQSGWYDFWTGEKIMGGKYISRSTPIDIIPLYVREGSIIAMGESMQYATQNKGETLEIRIYRGKDASFCLYEDENDNYNYEKGAYTCIPFTWNEAQMTLTIGKRSGKFSGMLKKRKFNIVFVSEKQGYGDMLTQKEYHRIHYKGKELKLKKK